MRLCESYFSKQGQFKKKNFPGWGMNQGSLIIFFHFTAQLQRLTTSKAKVRLGFQV
jgi:hypothetical protein